jgi:adenine phosphoribosyltransferase
MTLEILRKSIEESSIIKKGNYSYLINPLTDGIPSVQPQLLHETINEMKNRIKKFFPIDKILTIEAMGIPLASALSLEINIPYVIVRKRSYNLPNEITINQKTGYSESGLFINGLKPKEKIVIVDDIISTGGTLKSIVSSLIKNSIKIKGIVIVIDKGKAVKNIEKEFNLKIETLIKIDIEDGLIKIKNIS